MSHSVFEFSKNLIWDDLSDGVQHQAKRCLLDLIGVAAAGTTTDMSKIICGHATHQFGAGKDAGARLLFDGRRVSASGAAMANGMTIDSIDAHDGHPLTKGHAGCGIFPGLMALIEANELEVSGQEFLTTLVIGYEVAIRAGIALHATVADYHTSGAWVGLGIAAMAARLLDMDEAHFNEAIGIAEYHGPRSQMMRVIDFPTMVKDGSGWGAMAGVSAVYLARDGFTGAPAISLTGVDATQYYDDLGAEWYISGLYFKMYPVCRWAQPPVEAVLQLKKEHIFQLSDIQAIKVYTFHEAYRLSTKNPQSTEAAQYSMPFSVAAALLRGTIGPNEVGDNGLNDPDISKLANLIEPYEDDLFNAKFPAERWARVEIILNDGTVLKSDPAVALGSAENPLSDATIHEKYHNLAKEILTKEHATKIEDTVWALDAAPGVSDLFDLVLNKPH